MKLGIILMLFILVALLTGCAESSFESCHNVCETSNYVCTADKSVFQCVAEINSNQTL